MQQPDGVDGAERVRNLHTDVDNEAEFKRAPSDECSKRLTTDKLHHHEANARLIPNVVDRDDIWVRQCGDGLRLTGGTVP